MKNKQNTRLKVKSVFRLASIGFVLASIATPLGLTIKYYSSSHKTLTTFKSTDMYKTQIESEIKSIEEEFSKYDFNINTDQEFFNKKQIEYKNNLKYANSNEHALDLMKKNSAELTALYNQAESNAEKALIALALVVVGELGLVRVLSLGNNELKKQTEQSPKEEQIETLPPLEKPTEAQLQAVNQMDNDLAVNPRENEMLHR